MWRRSNNTCVSIWIERADDLIDYDVIEPTLVELVANEVSLCLAHILPVQARWDGLPKSSNHQQNQPCQSALGSWRN